jgi:hypothetical protein
MKSISPFRRLVILGSAVTLALALWAGTKSGPRRVMAQSAQQGGQGAVVGAWINTVTVNTSLGPQPLTTELVAINPGGTSVDTLTIAHSSQNPFFAGSPLAVDFSDAIGTWEPVPDSNRIAFTFKRYLFAGANTPTTDYGSFFPGQNVGQATIEAVGTLQTSASGQTLSGPFTFQLTNLQGTLVLNASGTFSATRLQIQPLATP